MERILSKMLAFIVGESMVMIISNESRRKGSGMKPAKAAFRWLFICSRSRQVSRMPFVKPFLMVVIAIRLVQSLVRLPKHATAFRQKSQ